MFTPCGTKDGPDIETLSLERTTRMQVSGEGEKEVEDYWMNPEDAHKVQSKKWTGATVLKKTQRTKTRDEKEAFNLEDDERLNKIMANLKSDGRMTMDVSTGIRTMASDIRQD